MCRFLYRHKSEPLPRSAQMLKVFCLTTFLIFTAASFEGTEIEFSWRGFVA